MAWIEIPALRGKGSRVYRDDANPLKGVVSAQAGTAWHFKSDPDGGYWDQEVDLRPERILAGGHDGWRVTANSWHYFLGQPNGLPDGFVGFGGRQGDKWLLFRLLRTGYLHWPTRAWEDIGGAPDYDRANLSREDHSTVNTVGEEIHVETVATWSDIWNTPGGGALDVSWRADGNRLKEEITINQAARDWITANRPPSTPASETYFGFVFRLGSALDVDSIEMDLSYLPRWLKNGVLQNTDDFDDDDGTAGIEVQNALEQFLFFLPISKAYIEEVVDTGRLDNGGNPVYEYVRHEIKLRRRIYKDGSSYYLMVGALATDLVGLPAGDLVFDPSIEDQTGASSHDAWQDSGDTASITAPTHNMGTGDTGASPNCACGYYFDGLGDLSGATIDSGCYIEVYKKGAEWKYVVGTWFGNDVDTPSVFSSEEDITARTYTTASVACESDVNYSDNTYYKLPEDLELQDVIAELVAREGYGSTMAFIFDGDGGSNWARTAFSPYDDDSTNAPKLHIEYTEAAGGETLEGMDAFHTHPIEDVTLSQAFSLTDEDSFHVHEIADVSLSQKFALTVEDSFHSHQAADVTLTEKQDLTVEDSFHTHKADDVTLTTGATITGADAFHAHTAADVTLTQKQDITVEDSFHTHAAADAPLVAAGDLASEDSFHTHITDDVTLTQKFSITVEGSEHGHEIDDVTLTQKQALSIEDSFHSHQAEDVTLVAPATLQISDCFHVLKAEDVTLTQPGLDVTSYWPRRRKYVYQEEWELLQGEFEDEELVMLLLD